MNSKGVTPYFRLQPNNVSSTITRSQALAAKEWAALD